MPTAKREHELRIMHEWLIQVDNALTMAKRARVRERKEAIEIGAREHAAARALMREGTPEQRKLALRFLPYPERRHLVGVLRSMGRRVDPQSAEGFSRKMAHDVSEILRGAISTEMMRAMTRLRHKPDDVVGTLFDQADALKHVRDTLRPRLQDMAREAAELVRQRMLEASEAAQEKTTPNA